MRSSLIRRVLFIGGVAAILVAGFVPSAAGFDGWSVQASPNPGVYGNMLLGVSARNATDIWAVGRQATATSNNTLAVHWDGARWSAVPTPNPGGDCDSGNFQWVSNTLDAVAVVNSKDVWAVGSDCAWTTGTLVEHWNGTSWSIVPSANSPSLGDGGWSMLSGVAAVSASNIWAVGSRGSGGSYQTLVEHWDGTSWSVVASPSPGDDAGLYAIAAVGPSDIWAVGSSGDGSLIEHWDGTSWSVVPSPVRKGGSELEAITALSSTDIWAVGSQRRNGRLTLAVHWNGSRWSVSTTPNTSTEYSADNFLRGVTAVSANDVWAVGMWRNESTIHQRRTLTMHWNGVKWDLAPSPSPGRSSELFTAGTVPGGQVLATGLFSNYDVNIYDGTYTQPRTLVLGG